MIYRKYGMGGKEILQESQVNSLYNFKLLKDKH